MADLSPERRQQIEEEERQRHAEEQYRQQVRADLKGPSEPAPKKSRTPWIILGVALIISPVLITLTMHNANEATTSASSNNPNTKRGLFAPTVRYVPVSQTIASGQVLIPARGYVQYRIQITPDMRNAEITGSFNASGGSGNDVAAALTVESEFTNWINGHQARVFYGAEGRKTRDMFDVHIGPGTYIFAISNQFSTFTQKYVFLDVMLNYSKLEIN